jgi:hypothetical protein
MSDPWAEFTPAPRQIPPQSDPWAEFSPAPSSGGVSTIPAHDGRPARVIMEMGQSQTPPLQPPEQSQPGIIEDSIRGFGGGLIRGAAGTVGLVTDTIPSFIADKANWLEGKIRGETPEQSQTRMAERRTELRQFSPALADAAQTVGKHLSTRGLQEDIEAVTGPAYVPQTRAGKFASTAGEFVPGAMIGGPANMARNAVAYGVVPGLVSEGAGQAFEGSAMETPARIAGGLVGGLGSAAAMKSGVAPNMVRNAAQGVTAAELDAAEQLFQQARQHGIDISRAEALQSVTQGRTGMGELQHTVEGMGGMRNFYAQRPAQNEAAARQAFDNVAPRAADPSQLGPVIGGHAEGIVQDVRSAINAATRPMYDAAGQHLVPHQVHAAMMADPLFEETVRTIRNDPARNAMVRSASDRSVRMYDAVAKELEQRSRNAGQPLNPQANQAVSSVTGSLGGGVKDVAIASEKAATNGPSAYQAALATQSRLRQQYLEPLLNGPIGKVAGRDTKTRDAVNALFPASPLPNSAREIGQAVQALSARSPVVARQLVRTHAEMTFNEAAQRLASSGPAQGGGAKFAAILRGNPQQAANLEAAVRALPNGDQIWPGFNRFLEVMEAQQFRQATGSRTAFKIPGVENLKSGGLANNTAQIVATGGFKWPQKAMQAIQNWNVGRNLDELARLLTDPAVANQFRAIVTAPRGSNKALALAARLSVMANSGARIERRPGVVAR